MRRIRIEAGGASAFATLLDEKAPIACGKLWDALPIKASAEHGRWSGNMVVTRVAALIDLGYAAKPCENPVYFLDVGSLSYLASSGELNIAYGGQSQIRDAQGMLSAARIADLEDASALLAALSKTSSIGAIPIAISREP
jgi:hypothetical protein